MLLPAGAAEGQQFYSGLLPSAHDLLKAVFAEHFALCRAALDLHEPLAALLAPERWIDLCLIGGGDVHLFHSQQILVSAAQNSVDDLGAQSIHLLPLPRRKLARRRLQPQGIHAPEDISLEVDPHGPALIARVEGECLLAVVDHNQIALACSAAQQELDSIHAAGFVLGDADQLLILGAGIMLPHILCYPVAHGQAGADMAVKLGRHLKVLIHINHQSGLR